MKGDSLVKIYPPILRMPINNAQLHTIAKSATQVLVAPLSFILRLGPLNILRGGDVGAEVPRLQRPDLSTTRSYNFPMLNT